MLLVNLALAAPCPTILETRTAYRPSTGELSVAGDEGGWNKSALASLTPSARAKVEQYKKAFKRYPVDVQERLLSGELPDGLDEVAVVLAYGEPGYVWETDRSCIGMLYGLDPAAKAGNVVFEACDGAVVDQIDLIRPIPCTRIAAGDDRWSKKSKHLMGYTFSQQVDVLAGHRAEWMDERALELAFGKNGTLAEGMGPVQAEPTPQSVDLTPATVSTSKPRPASTPSSTSSAGDDPVAPVRSGVRTDVLSDGEVTRGEWSFEADCGVVYTIEVEIADTFVARASARDASGGLLHHTTRGVVGGGEDRNQLFGLGVLRLEPVTLELGPWPIAACAGVEAPAR